MCQVIQYHKLLVSFINNSESKAALILAKRRTIGYRDAALNVARLQLQAVTERFNGIAEMRHVDAGWRSEVEFFERLKEKAEFVLNVYENTDKQ